MDVLWSVYCAVCSERLVQCAVCSVRLEQEEATLSPPCLPLPCPVQYNVVAATLSYMYMFMWYTTLSQRGEKSHKSHPIQPGGSNIILHSTLSHSEEKSHKSQMIKRGGSNIILHATLSHRGERSHKSHPIQCGGLSQ